MTSYFSPRSLQALLENTILPWAQSGELLLTVASPEFPAPAGVTVAPQKTAPRSTGKFRGASQRDARWMKLGLHCRSTPIVMIVLEGEADMRIGRLVEKEKGHAGSASTDSYEFSIYTLPVRSCLIVPPDVAHSDGSTPHWERPDPQNARSQIFWMQFLSIGVICHLCRTEGLSHTHNTALFIRDLQLSLMMQFFLERASETPDDTGLLASFMNTMLQCFESSRARLSVTDGDQPEFSGEVPHGLLPSTLATSQQSEAFSRARLYIDSHLTDALSPAQIARQTHISVSQLSRLFHARLGMPVMKYVTQRRIDEAKSLLVRTSLTTETVAQICGYPQRAHFSRVFKEQTGLPPMEYRRQRSRQGAGHA